MQINQTQNTRNKFIGFVYFLLIIILSNACYSIMHLNDPTKLSYKIIVQPMNWYMDQLFNVFNSYTVAVILLTISVKVVLLPINITSIKHHSNHLKMFTLIVQLPVLIALYSIVKHTDKFISATLLGVPLNEPNVVFVSVLLCIATYNYLKQYRFHQIKYYYEIDLQTRFIATIMPLLLAIPALHLPASLTLYLIISSCFTTIQTILIQRKTPLA